MKKIKFLMLSLTIVAATSAFAQDDKKEKGADLSIGLEAGLPIGDFNKSVGFGIGGSAKVGIPVFEGGDVTISAGYTTFMAKDVTVSGITIKGASFGYIPFKAGLRFNVSEGFYAEPQLGYSIGKSNVSGAKSSGAFTYAAGVGYKVNNMVDIGVRYEAFSAKEETVTIDQSGNFTTSSTTKALGFVGLRIAYSFGL